MNITGILAIGGGVLCALLMVTLVMLFVVSRKSQHVMESILEIMLHPERARVQDAARVLNTIMADEIGKVESHFQTMQGTLNAEIKSANELKSHLDEQNNKLVGIADNAAKNVATMSQRLENTVTGLDAIVSAPGWTDVAATTDKFNATLNELLGRIDTTTTDTTDKILQIREQIDAWLAESKNLATELQSQSDANTEQNKNLTETATELRTKLSELADSTATGFTAVKTAAADYGAVMKQNNQMLDEHLDKMDAFSKNSKKQLTSQVNTISNTADAVSGQVRLAESSIEKQVHKLNTAVSTLMSSAESTENSVQNISAELATLTNRFNTEIKEFVTSVVAQIKAVSGVANTTLDNTRTAAGAFSESVRTMATGVRETLIEMNTAHTQLTGQSENLIKMTAQTTAQLQPLSELMEKYFTALPDLSRSSVETSENLGQIVARLNEKITAMKTTVSESTTTIADSATKLEDLAGQSRQQMIDLMSDYAKAVTTMQTLNKQMMVARASAPMDAIKVAPAEHFARVSNADFMNQCEKAFEKMHEQSMDLVRATGAEIPDVVLKKYHAGDKTIFSKWLLKVLKATTKKRISEMLKSDAVFRSQATQFVRSFDKILTGAQNADDADNLSATLIKTDLGQIYVVLKNNM